MNFVLSKLLWLVVQPGNLLLLLLCLGLLLQRSRWRGWGRGLVGLVVATFVALTLLPLGAWLGAPLEERFAPPAPMPETVAGIILLGGASQPRITAARGQPTLNGSGERVVRFVELARRYPEARLAFSGGSGALIPGPLMEAEVVRRLLVDLGVDVERVSFDDEARNTFENARNLFAALQPADDGVWLLVTSARHMPRAVGLFRALEWRVVPYPVDYRTSGRFLDDVPLSLTDGLQTLTLAAREWLGLVAYYLMGRISSPFPAPSDAG